MAHGNEFKDKLRAIRGDTMGPPETATEVLAAAALGHEIEIRHLSRRLAILEGKICGEDTHTSECVHLSAVSRWILCHLPDGKQAETRNRS